MNDKPIEIEKRELKGVDWNNDALFFTYEWWDETSQFDTHPSKRWCGGLDCYERKYRLRVPRAFEHCDELLDNWVEKAIDSYPDVAGLWVD